MPQPVHPPQSEKALRITVGQLREYLRPFGDHAEVTFGTTIRGAPLVFYRVKSVRRDDGLVLVELNELDLLHDSFGPE
jgi:hypothetical protein